jgi:hypothetical protein
MDKKTKMILGVGALAIAGYLIYQNNKKKNFSVANMTQRFSSPNLFGVPMKIINKK